LTLEIGRLGVNCGLVPSFEIENSSITKVRKMKRKIPVSDYLKEQKQYRHLFDNQTGQKQLQKLQEMADHSIEKYGLMNPAQAAYYLIQNRSRGYRGHPRVHGLQNRPSLILGYMPRKARIGAPGTRHHIIVRGINRRKIYFDDSDRDDFLDRLGGILSDIKTPCFAWAFMTRLKLCDEDI
jgi:hypothetical protein